MSYEESVKRRRIENREFLKSIGISELCQDLDSNATSLQSSFTENSTQSPVGDKKGKGPKKRVSRRTSSSDSTPSRRSSRLLGKEAPKYVDVEEIESLLTKSRKTPIKSATPSVPSEKIKRENTFGAIAGVSVGTEFSTRLEASHAGIHRPTVAGIHGNPALGCYSIALSGGYEDDVDLGETFIYTGEGGRDLKGTKANPKNLRTAPQSKDQVLARGNLALSRNVENNVPVRVLRGYKLNSKYAPEEGYRYDGLYKVTKYYRTTGKSGFDVYKFKFERLENQEPAPWSDDFKKEEGENSAILSEKEKIPTNEAEASKVTPLSENEDVSNNEMEVCVVAPLSERENSPNKEMKACEVVPLSDNGNLPNDEMEVCVVAPLSERENSPNGEMKACEVVPLSDYGNLPNDVIEVCEVGPLYDKKSILNTEMDE